MAFSGKIKHELSRILVELFRAEEEAENYVPLRELVAAYELPKAGDDITKAINRDDVRLYISLLDEDGVSSLICATISDAEEPLVFPDQLRWITYHTAGPCCSGTNDRLSEFNRLVELLEEEGLIDRIMNLKASVAGAVPEKAVAAEERAAAVHYERCIGSMFRTGRGYEEGGSPTRGMNEEQIRQFFKSALEGLEIEGGSFAAEAYRKIGKTDIVGWLSSKTSFLVAECKFWKGQQTLSDAISQLFSYCLERDKFLAVVLFVRKGKSVAEICGELEGIVERHKDIELLESEHCTGKSSFRIKSDETERSLTILVFEVQ